ncbi:hypothetical protein CRE_28952 [Caenorhabditis remanei]|uniref:F-box domain-containing protein n=1 Tax=Caenorhabditis remanei TaxID=31234 RepID=E3N5D8_CAERE|nr:hypothetical protein CRE_28952 [Caenorhabditis remanei]
MTIAFPLLRLPYLVLMPILEQMEFMERISLSILSKRARMFLKLLKMKCKYINLILNDDRLEMTVVFENSEELNVNILMIGYQVVDLRYGHDHISKWPCTLSPLDYVLPIMDVTHCKSIKQFIVFEIPQRDIFLAKLPKILEKLPEIDEVIVDEVIADNTYYISSSDSPLFKVLSIVLPVSSAVTISYHVLKPEDFQEIFKGNFDAVTLTKYWDISYFFDMPNDDMKFALNDLIMTNVRSLELQGPAFTLEDLNLYFKLWMKKKCNPRLEYLVIAIRRWAKSDILNPLLKGLKAVQIPIETKREFRVLGNIKQFTSEVEDEMLNWEFDITRDDGKQATIRIGTHGTVCFYVWPEFAKDTTHIKPNQSSLMRKCSRLSSFYNSCIKHFK